MAVGKEVDVNETKAISSGGKAIETDNKKAAKEVGKEIVEEIAKGNLVLDYVMLHMEIWIKILKSGFRIYNVW